MGLGWQILTRKAVIETIGKEIKINVKRKLSGVIFGWYMLGDILYVRHR